MDKRILLPTDFSKNALNAIRYAFDLYKDVNCDFYLLNTFQTSGYTLESMMVPESGEKQYEASKKQSHDGMERLMTMLALHPENPKHTIHTVCTFNSLLMAVEHLVAKKDIDIIVMGTKGLTASSNVVFGTNTVTIMEKITQCPVLAIPEGYHFSAPKELVFATDYKAKFKRRELNYLIEIAKMHGSRIRVLYVSRKKHDAFDTRQKNNKQLLEDIFEKTDFSTHILKSKDVSDGINAFVQSRNSDLIAFLNKKHLFFSSVLSNPLVKEIGYNTNIPVLVLNDIAK